MNQAFDILQHILAFWDSVTVIIGDTAPGWHVISGLLDNSQALAHFFYPHQIAGITIPFRSRGDLKIKIFITAIRKRFAQIPLQATGSQIGSGYAPLHGIFKCKPADSLGSRFENGIFAD